MHGNVAAAAAAAADGDDDWTGKNLISMVLKQ